MKPSKDLLDQARHLLRLNPRKPAQVNLRRSVSALYYALFHAWTAEAASCLAIPADLRENVKRSISHAELRKLFNGVRAEGVGVGSFCKVATSKELADFAALFTKLQGRRLSADYDWSARFQLRDVAEDLFEVEAALRRWRSFVKAGDVQALLAMTVISKERLQPRRED